MASHLIKRMRQRLRAPEPSVLAAELPLRRKQLVLARAIRNTVLPQELWLESGESRLGISAAWRRIYGISLRVPEGEDINLRIPDIPQAEQPRIAAILHSCIRQFLDQDKDIRQGAEPLAEVFPQTGGLPAGVVLRAAPRLRAKPALHVVPAADPANPIEAAMPDNALSGSAPPVSTMPVSMADMVARLQVALGPRLLLVWLPADGRDMAECLGTMSGPPEIRSFRPQELGLILRDRP